jgi:hypothetical protein
MNIPRSALFLAMGFWLTACSKPALRGPFPVRLVLAVQEKKSTNGIPDLTLTIVNESARSLSVPDYRGVLAGEIVITCGDETLALRHRVFWGALATGQYDVPRVTIAPGQSVVADIKLQKDFVTHEEFQNELLRESGTESWVTKIKKNRRFHAFYHDDFRELVSNELLVDIDQR